MNLDILVVSTIYIISNSRETNNLDSALVGDLELYGVALKLKILLLGVICSGFYVEFFPRGAGEEL